MSRYIHTWSLTDKVWNGTRHLTHLTAINKSRAVVSCILSQLGVILKGNKGGVGGVATLAVAKAANGNMGGATVGGGWGGAAGGSAGMGIPAWLILAFDQRSWVRSAKRDKIFCWASVLPQTFGPSAVPGEWRKGEVGAKIPLKDDETCKILMWSVIINWLVCNNFIRCFHQFVSRIVSTIFF